MPDEQRSVQRFIGGIDHDPSDEAYFAEGFAEFRRLTSTGRRLERVRIHDDPPTGYQRWLRWLGRWNAQAGEVIHYLARPEATTWGLVGQQTPGDDFWLFDDAVVVTLRFDTDGRLVEASRDESAVSVQAAVAWKTAALRYVNGAAPPKSRGVDLSVPGDDG